MMEIVMGEFGGGWDTLGLLFRSLLGLLLEVWGIDEEGLGEE